MQLHTVPLEDQRHHVLRYIRVRGHRTAGREVLLHEQLLLSWCVRGTVRRGCAWCMGSGSGSGRDCHGVVTPLPIGLCLHVCVCGGCGSVRGSVLISWLSNLLSLFQWVIVTPPSDLYPPPPPLPLSPTVSVTVVTRCASSVSIVPLRSTRSPVSYISCHLQL